MASRILRKLLRPSLITDRFNQPPFITSTISSRQTQSHTSLNNVPANCPSPQLLDPIPPTRANTTTIINTTPSRSHGSPTPSQKAIARLHQSRAHSRVTMSNQPSPGPLPPDASEEMPLELFRLPHGRHLSLSGFLGRMPPPWSFPPLAAGNRAFALSARRYMKNILGVSFIKYGRLAQWQGA